MLNVTLIPVTPFEQNCSLLVCEATKKAAVVDPGGDVDRILKVMNEQGVQIEKILLTHGHLDHCGGAAELARRCHVPIEGPHIEEKFWLDRLPQQAQQFKFPPAEVLSPNRWLNDGDTVMVGNVSLSVLHCPGHTPGHVVFFSEADRLAFVGDVLFAGSIGRTDFPRGDYQTLIHAIRTKLWVLGNDVTFIPGHGSLSTFGEERVSNPYVADGQRC